MVTFSPERGVVPLLKVALKVTCWLTAGVVLLVVIVMVEGVRLRMRIEATPALEGP
jgi:hypothetical protein